MRILVISPNYSPELIGIGKFNGEMASWLARRGHEVRVVTAPPHYPHWRVCAGYYGFRYQKEKIEEVTVIRCPIFVPRSASALGRLIHLASFGIFSLPVVLALGLLWHPDVVLVVEPPLFAAPGALLAAKFAGVTAHLHVQDFEVDAAFRLGLLKGDRVQRIAFAVERWVMRRFGAVSTISSRMAIHLSRKGIAEASIRVFPNWADMERFRPLDHPNPWRSRLGVEPDDVVVLYSGNFGRKQGLETLVATARRLAGRADIRFVLCGNGAGRADLERAATGLANVSFLPLQPVEELNALLNAADIHVLPQRADVADLVMPSKLGGMLASGRPVVAGAAPGTQVYDMVQDCGVAVAPEDAREMSLAIEALAGDRERRIRLGAAARAKALEHWDRDVTLRRLEAFLLGTEGLEESPASAPMRTSEPVGGC